MTSTAVTPTMRPPIPLIGSTPIPRLLVRAPSVLLLGESGTGKTDSLVELITLGLELFVVVTEANGVDTLLDSCHRRKADISKLHYKVIEPAPVGFDNLKQIIENVEIMNHESLTKMAPGMRQGSQLLATIANFRDFHCERTNTRFGSIARFGPDKAVALDSLSGLSDMAMEVTVGGKVTAHQGEWGIAMKLVKQTIKSLTCNLQCMFVLTAHEAREPDEIHGGSKIMAHTLGKKLAPDLPKEFSEVVQTLREGANFYWSTASPNVALKFRSLPLGNRLPPSYAPVLTAYNRRLAQVEKPS